MKIMTENDPDDDKSLFHQEMAQVKPLKPSNKIPHKSRASASTGRNQYAEEPAESEVEDTFSDFPTLDCPDNLQFSRDGVQKSLFKKLRNAKLPLENHLDLHGKTVAQARTSLQQFISECTHLGCRCALVIHGKGYSSPNNKPVIKAYVNRWLQESSSVLAFSSALPCDGGSGAVYVLFKRKQ